MKTPIHLWGIGCATLLWNAAGAYDYLMTQVGNVTYMARLADEQVAFLQTVPM